MISLDSSSLKTLISMSRHYLRAMRLIRHASCSTRGRSKSIKSLSFLRLVSTRKKIKAKSKRSLRYLILSTTQGSRSLSQVFLLKAQVKSESMMLVSCPGKCSTDVGSSQSQSKSSWSPILVETTCATHYYLQRKKIWYLATKTLLKSSLQTATNSLNILNLRKLKIGSRSL